MSKDRAIVILALSIIDATKLGDGTWKLAKSDEPSIETVAAFISMLYDYNRRFDCWPEYSDFATGYTLIAKCLSRECVNDNPCRLPNKLNHANEKLRRREMFEVREILIDLMPEPLAWIDVNLPLERFTIKALPCGETTDMADCLIFDDPHADAPWRLWAGGRRI